MVKIQEIADCHGISKNHLSVAVNKLSELGYIQTTQGPKGGLTLTKTCENKSLAELVLQIEDFEIAECFNSKDNRCILNPYCKLKGILSNANQAFIGELKKFKIKDLS